MLAPQLWPYWLNKQLILALLAACLCLPGSLLAGANTVKNIRVAKSGQVTRVVFDTTGIPSYKLFTLNNPSRVVIDLSNAQLSTSVNPSAFTSSFVKSLRHAQRSDNKLRIVLDLNQATVPNSFVLPPNKNAHHRLVIDLKRPGTDNRQANRKPAAKLGAKSVASKATKKPASKAISKQAAAAKNEDIIAKVTKPAKPKQATVTTQAKPTIKQPARKPATNKVIVVAIDPGHGGKDPGATGYAGTREKDVVLKISQRLVRLINAEKGMRAIMTRDSDKFLSLRGRIKKARDKKADIFISIHADAVEDRSVRGSSVYVLSKNGASSEAASFLAKSQNSSDVIGGVKLQGKGKDVQKVLVDLSQAATIDASMKLASAVKSELGRLGKTRKRVEHAGFVVLKSPDIPSILVETAFISNASEEKKLRSATHQQKLAVSVFKGLKTYLKQDIPRQALIASNKHPHTIKSGETLSGIAVRYRVSVDSIRKTNALHNDRIRVGQTILIPEV